MPRKLCIDLPSAEREGIYLGFQGVKNLIVANNSSSNVKHVRPLLPQANEALMVVESTEKSPKLADDVFSNNGSIISRAFFTTAFCFDAATMGFRHLAIDQSNARIEYIAACGLRCIRPQL